MRITPQEFRRAPWHVHDVLADVPLHDVWSVRLVGGGPGRHLRDFRALGERGAGAVGGSGPRAVAVRSLVAIRRGAGALFGWDERAPGAAPPASSYVHRLDAATRARSVEPPGRPMGIFRVVYAFEDESLGEIINGTVHAFSFFGMAPTAEGYGVHWAIYVRPIGRITGAYMMAIDPFRRGLVYPTVIAGWERAWRAAHSPGSGPAT